MTLRLPLRLALRELRGGLAGFRVFLACLALGVAAIAAVGSVRAAIETGLAREAAALLGGDAAGRQQLTQRARPSGSAGRLHEGECPTVMISSRSSRSLEAVSITVTAVTPTMLGSDTDTPD